ncbi:MAG: thiamine pyrophosphate-dependent enzyme [Bacteroidales bacterium]|jgi:thiamine pyrophosphate-dependent acetolactate synthase large subunit-like protein|nr:thiamine pyrophosphate-dependent enzyme [Bacteroidales bacterium]
MNVSEQLLNILSNEGVRHIFGVAGDALNPLVSAIARQDAIKWVRVKHEGNASYAAFAQGELNGNLGVCASTVGPGALHLVNGLYNAKAERSPVLAITGQIPVEKMGTNFFQEVNLEKVFDDICDYQAIVRSPEEAPKVMLKAIRTAINNKSVCRIELPADIAEMKAENNDFVHRVFRSESATVPSQKQIEKAALMINESERTGIFGGAGCRGAREEVLALARKINAPITHTLRASDIFDHDTKNVVGLTGLIGNPSGYKAIMDCDLLIMMGTDFPYTDYLPPKTKTIQIDIRPENIGNRTPVSLGMEGNIKETVTALISHCKTKKDSVFLDELKEEFSGWKAEMEKDADPENDLTPMHPQIIAWQLSELAADDAVFAIDTGTSAIWASNHMSFHSGRRMIGSFNHGSMAVGLPAAIGAQAQYPDREVWAMVGDGAFNMALQDFSTAVDHNLPLKIIVFNNSELGFVKIEMEEAGLAPNFDALQVNNFNFSEYAKLCGGDGIKVEKAEDVIPAIKKAKKSTKPFVIDAVVTKGELSLPPKVGVGKAKDFSISKVKEIVKAIGGDKKQWDNIKKEIEAYFK